MTEEPQNGESTEEILGPREKVAQILQRARLSKHAISRGEVLRGLTDCEPLHVVDIVREYIAEGDNDTQELAIEALAYIPAEHPDARAGLLCLIEILEQGNENHVLKALEVLTRQETQGMDKHFIALSRHQSDRVRQAVAERLATLNSVAATRALISLSREDLGDVRLWGLHHLRQLAFSHNMEVQALAAKRLAQQDPSTSTTAPIVLLARKQDKDVRDTLRELLKKEIILEETVEASLELKDPALYEYLWDANWRWDGQPELMEKALAVCHWDDPRSTDDLIDQALNSKNYIAAEQAVALLQRRDDEPVYDEAIKLTQCDTTEERHLGARILGKLGGPNGRFRAQAAPALISLLEDKSETIISEAVRSLGGASAETVESTINQLKNHPHGEVRRLVSFVLFGIDDHTSPEVLVALSTAREGMVRLAATQALTSILTPQPGVEPSAQTPVGMPLGGKRGKAQEFDEDEDFESYGYGRASPQALGSSSYAGADYNPQDSSIPKPTRQKRFLIFAAAGLIVITILGASLYILQQTQRSEIDLQTENLEASEVPDLNSEQMIDSKAKSRMFGDRRAAQVLSMLKRPIRALLTDKSECWYMYFRMDIRDSTSIISRAKVPKSKNDVDAIALEYLTRLITGEVNGDHHEKAGKFLISLVVRNPKLGSYLFERVISDINFYQRDDLIRDMAVMSEDFRARLAGEGFSTAYHPGLGLLTPRARKLMIDELQGGWSESEEYILSRHLSQIKN